MFPYWLLISLPILFALLNIHDKLLSRIALNITALIYIIFIGLRDEVGADWEAYSLMYEHIYWYTFNDALFYTEPSFSILNWLFGKSDLSIIAVNTVIALFFVSGLIRFARLMPNPWLALVSVTPYLVIAIGMSAERQSAAIGLIFHLLASWKKSVLRKILLWLFASSFHYSAVFGIIFVIQSIKFNVWLKYSLLSISIIFSYQLFNDTDIYEKYSLTYIENDLLSPGALMHVLLNAIPACCYLLFIKKWQAVFNQNDLIILLSLLSLLSIVGVFFSSTGVDRLALYLSPIQMLIYGSLSDCFKKHRVMLSSAIIIYHCVILYWWLNYANTAPPFLPYRNILFE